MHTNLNKLGTSNQDLKSLLGNFIRCIPPFTSGTLPSNTVTNPKEDLKGITTRSGVAYKGPAIHTTSSPKVMERDTEPQRLQLVLLWPNQKASIPFFKKEMMIDSREKANDQIEKFYEIFRDLSFEISFTDALMLMPKFASTLKTLIENKKKLSEMARTPLNENCSAVILNKLPKKLGDPGRFLIPCEFSGINTCNALADLGASINLMPYSVWKNLSLPELTPTCMTLELADRSISEQIGIAEDVYVTVGKFQFSADFVVVDFEPDPRVPLILGRSFLKTSRALIVFLIRPKDQGKDNFTCPIRNICYRGAFWAMHCTPARTNDWILSYLPIPFGQNVLKRSCEDTILVFKLGEKPFHGEGRHCSWTQKSPVRKLRSIRAKVEVIA
ncbi:reverse transcriptase domain-containing protein [Tanacetum coccineum]